MSNEPIIVPGVDAPVSVVSNFWTGRQRVTVGDRLAATTGKRTYALPTANGETVEGKVSRTTLINPFPTLEVGGVRHPTGPEVPVALRVLMVAPILLIALGGLVGGVVAIGAVFVNFTIARSASPTATKALLMALTFAAAIAIWAGLAAVILQ
jgi:hypothetical protein